MIVSLECFSMARLLKFGIFLKNKNKQKENYNRILSWVLLYCKTLFVDLFLEKNPNFWMGKKPQLFERKKKIYKLLNLIGKY